MPHIEFARKFLQVAPLLQYLPASTLLELTSQSIELARSHAEHEYAKEVLLMSLYLRLIGVQYTPTLHYTTSSERTRIDYADSVDSKNPDSIIYQCKLLSE